MKNTLIKKGSIATAVLGFGLMLSACGGGGGGGSPSSVVPSTYQGVYTGALQPGDFVSFYVSGNTLSYTVTGSFASQYCNQSPQPQSYATCVNSNSITGTLTLTQIPGLSGTNYFEATAGSSTVYVFLSGSTGIFAVPTQSATLAFIGYSNTLSATSISAYISSQTFKQNSHTFIYASYTYTPGSSGSVDIYSLTVSPSNSFSYSNVDTGTSGSGCWMIDPKNPNRIIAIDGDTITTSIYPGTTSFTCSTFVKSWTNNLSSWAQDYNIILTPTHGIIVDYTGANTNVFGIGVGVKSASLSLTNSNTYTIQSLNSSLAIESIAVSITSTSPGQQIGSYSDLYTEENGQTASYTGQLIYDKDCNNNPISGIISAHNTKGECYDIFFDPTDHYYVAVQSLQSSPTISIGAIQQ